ncbi:LamG-like jellyroll fold domain-containing protein [Roseibacillus persicicus]|uniref:LamG-like jellyroll fold domain-containing protein n=1 Tax=Roseibacillus persicicus TaxID=454148 RepID=UPI0028108E0E|nr:LamG-like jellyroll fold domain-containing protein [Roseibacillus persicicus]MDQ8190616.1 metallophosphoesterase [Roseibacillus persicicus]
MKRIKAIRLGCLLLPVLAPLSLFSQEKELENLTHDRHTHTHNSRHERVPAMEDRFFTNREGAPLELTNEEPMFTFAVFGDRTGGPDSGVNILADAVRDVNLLEPDLVMTVGDLIQGYNTSEKWMPQMKEYKGIMNNLLCPWFPVAGNHDIYWRGDNRPTGEHEPAYETHFGPLWYAFEHKDCFFIVLYSDEANPENDERNFHKPESQKMSPEQFEWLKDVLGKAKDSEHVFLFLHHPRWIGNNYGEDWKKVHDELVKAGNVSAVFAGHVHYMRSDPKDGIDYITLATTGGHQPGAFPSAGYLHHYHVVTVRENQVAITAYPVGEALDVRDITPELLEKLQAVSGASVAIEPALTLKENNSLDQKITVSMTNPVDRDLELTLLPSCRDSRWSFTPDHLHITARAGEKVSADFQVTRLEGALDEAFASPILTLQTEYLTESSRYPLPVREIPLPYTFATPPPSKGSFALDFNGSDQYIEVPSAKIPLDEAFTLEAWFKARSFGSRVGLATKTQGSEYGLFVNDGRPHFSVHLGGSYASVSSPQPMLKTNQWHHMAGVYDGKELRLYVDGVLVDTNKRSGKRKTNDLPLLIGADVTGNGGATSHFNGLIDTVRLSKVARYQSEQVEVESKLTSDDETSLLLNMDVLFGSQTYDQSHNGVHAILHGSPRQQAREQQ